MNGNNFKALYKASMNNITPDDELLEQIKLKAAKETAAPLQSNFLSSNKSFFKKHRTMLTAAATVALVIGVFAIGAVIMTDFYSLGTNESLSGAVGDEENCMDFNKDSSKTESGDIFSSIQSDEIYAPGAIDGKNEIPDNATASAEGNEAPDNATISEGENEYSNSRLFGLSEKAINGTLTPDDIGKITTIQDNGDNCHIYSKFDRNGTAYVLSADFETDEGDKLKPTSLTIIESDSESDGMGINLMSNSSHLDEYFSGTFKEKL